MLALRERKFKILFKTRLPSSRAASTSRRRIPAPSLGPGFDCASLNGETNW